MNAMIMSCDNEVIEFSEEGVVRIINESLLPYCFRKKGRELVNSDVPNISNRELILNWLTVRMNIVACTSATDCYWIRVDGNKDMKWAEVKEKLTSQIFLNVEDLRLHPYHCTDMVEAVANFTQQIGVTIPSAVVLSTESELAIMYEDTVRCNDQTFVSALDIFEASPEMLEKLIESTHESYSVMRIMDYLLAVERPLYAWGFIMDANTGDIVRAVDGYIPYEPYAIDEEKEHRENVLEDPNVDLRFLKLPEKVFIEPTPENIDLHDFVKRAQALNYSIQIGDVKNE